MKKFSDYGIAIIGIAVLVLFCACETLMAPAPAPAPVSAPRTSSQKGEVIITNTGIFGEQLEIPAKDFEPIGLVFTESKFEVNTREGTIFGENFTYQGLLKEAQALGAHGIINVVMDRVVENLTDDGVEKQEIWYGSALAVRFTNDIRYNDSILSKAVSYLTEDGISTLSPTKVGDVEISNNGRFGANVLVPVKNFEPVGLIFKDVEFEIDPSTSMIFGEIFTYNALLKEAQRLNAHGIINVVIDRRIEITRDDAGTTRLEKWSASALAIRYTNTIRSSDNIYFQSYDTLFIPTRPDLSE